MTFNGAKLALVQGDRVLAYLRDDLPGLSWAACWDLPGGGREGDEGPETCVLRELHEEFGLSFAPDRLEHGWQVPSMTHPGRVAWFYLGHISQDEVEAIRFGDEGQYWKMMPLAEFLAHPQGIPALQDRLGEALARAGWAGSGAAEARS